MALDQSFVTLVDRLGREKDSFVVQCVAAVAAAIDVVASSILESFVAGVRQLLATQDAQVAACLADELTQMPPVLLHLISSVTLSGSVLGPRALPMLGAACELVARVPSEERGGGPHQLQPIMLMVMEALGAQPALLLEHAAQVIRSVLSSIVVFLSSSRADVRMLALKAFSDMCTVLLSDSHVFEPRAERPSETTLVLEALLCSRVLPALPKLLGDEPPSPSCALRLLAALLSRGSKVADAAVVSQGLPQHLLAAFREQPVLSHTAPLMHCLLRGQQVEPRDLQSCGALDAVHRALEAELAASAGRAAHMDLAAVGDALCVAEEAILQTAAALKGARREAQQALLDGLGPLTGALPLLVAMAVPLAHARIAPLLDRAAGCCSQLAEVARACGGRVPAVELPSESCGPLLEALAAVARWKAPSAPEPSAQRAIQRRLLSIVAWAAGGPNASPVVRAELAAGVERLLLDRTLMDPAVAADARGVLAQAIGRGAG